ncbi:MAG: methyltransferase domain-containing protein [Ardenticatenaceae bacterium]|nr:methyltransferase domain-containing protein [Ardenticatenaceae bacterium]
MASIMPKRPLNVKRSLRVAGGKWQVQTRLLAYSQTIIGLMNEEPMPCVRPLTCPICHQPLKKVEGSLRCNQNHVFDIAREGYVNLMTGHKRPKIQGDDKVMLAARRRFLGKGYYQPLSDAINEIVLAHFPGQNGVVLDIGCGEGHYLGQLRPHLPAGTCTFGLDFAKDAARLAAKRYPASRFVVSDVNGRIPFADQSIHIMLNIFAPRNPAEFARVAVPGGRLLIVIPGPNHLRQLREELDLLDIEAEKQPRIVAQMAGLFTLQETQSLTFELDLPQPDLTDLVKMTPNYWHMTPTKQAQLQAMPHFQTSAHFQILAFIKAKG